LTLENFIHVILIVQIGIHESRKLDLAKTILLTKLRRAGGR